MVWQRERLALSDGTTERIRCKADYKVNGSGSA